METSARAKGRSPRAVVSIYDVARQAGVSITTVSRTFRTPELLNATTYQRVVQAAQGLGYRPSRQRQAVEPERACAVAAPTASAPGDTLPQAIALHVTRSSANDPWRPDSLYMPVLIGAQEEAAEHDLNVIVCGSGSPEARNDIPKILRGGLAVGMLIVGAALPDSRDLASFARHIPHLLLIDHVDPAGRFESVVASAFDGAYLATEYLLSIGHRQIVLFLGEPYPQYAHWRLGGYLSAHRDVGLMPARSLVLPAPQADSDPESERQFQALFQTQAPPTALVATCDAHALSLLRSCRRWGIRVPEDISVVGMGGTADALHADPPLTTVYVDREMMGRVAVRRLYARMRQSHPEAMEREGVRYDMPVSLAIGGSSSRK